MIHLDTSFLIRSLVSGSAEDRRLRAWIEAGREIAVSSVAWAELLCGPLDESQAELAGRLIHEVIPLTREDASLAANLFNVSGRRRGSLSDCMIAAIAIRRGAVLATEEPKGFQRFLSAGLKLADDLDEPSEDRR